MWILFKLTSFTRSAIPEILYQNSENRSDINLMPVHFRTESLFIENINLNDRFMFCGSMGLNNDLKSIMLRNKLQEGANNKPAEFVLEKAFVS